MGRYGGWGAADGVFAPGARGNDLRDQERLRAVLARLGGSAKAGERLFNAAGLTTLNAHYTDPLLVRAMYRALGDLGLEQGTVVDVGSGAGHFATFAPDGIRITGIELDPATALVNQLLHPEAEILVGSVSGPRFARVRDQSANPVRVPRDTASGFAGNVPFSDVRWPDEVLNPGQKFPLHDHAALWGVTRVAPGGLCAFITSRYTADKQNPGFRRTLAGEMDLIGMIRLPSTAHKRMAGTSVVTDIIIGRRLADGERPRTDPETWEQARPLPLPGTSLTALVNAYFHANPHHVLGTLNVGGMRHAGDFSVEPSGDLEQQLGAALGEITGRALAAGQRHEPRPAARPVIEILSRRPDGTVSVNPNGTFTQVVHGQDTPLEIASAREADQTRKLVAIAEALAALRKNEAACAEDTDGTDAARARLGQLYDDYTRPYGAIGRFTVRTQAHHVKTLKTILDRLDFSKMDVPDPEVALLEAYLGRGALARIVQSVTDPDHVRLGTRKDKQGNQVATQTQLVKVADVRAALKAALAEIPQGADAEHLAAAFGERMSRIETSEVRTRLMPVAFRSDPRRPAVESLENFDPVTQTATKKPVFTRRTAVPHRLELGADTPEEALDLVLIHHRRVDLGEVARLLGTDEANARDKLGTLVFADPAARGRLVAAGEYLSGNVREKLAQARTAAAGDPDRYTANVESLQAVQPAALGYEDIQARLGSAWLSRQIVQDGLREILDDPTLTVTHPGGAAWGVSTRKERNSNAQDRYGTSDWNAVDLAEALLTNASVVVYRKRIDPETGDEKEYRDDHATLFAYRKAQRLDADFVSWLWSDPDRADECVRLYNAAYNNQVKRKWDSAPFFIPGLAPGIRLHPFQNAMVRRLHTDSGLAAWVVGAGKTELGIVAAMEGNRLGRHQLAAVVCPAGLVNQWSNRIYSTYPQAQVLVADDDLRNRKDASEIFVERAASGDYQLAVVPYEFFGSLELSADAARASADEEIGKLTRYANEAASQGDRYTAKKLQGQIARIEAQYTAVAQGAGGATGFTDARIDSVIVDEWHNFRRITRASNNRSMAIIKGSDRADHMLAVFDYLRERHPEGLLLGLSGTPLEQSIADAWTAMRFFAPGKLNELGLEEFDAFLTTFGRTEARREPTPTGSGLHVRERASDWFNLPEMRRTLWDPFADVVRSADLGLNVPRLAGGRPQTHVLPQTPGQASVQAEIDEGYARFKAGDRGPDNHILRLMDRAAKNALHPRMLGMETDGKIKLEAWADDAAAWYHATKDARFLDREGNPHPRPGALRMVACEIGVPDPARPNAWSVYAEMRSLLVARGVPADTVRFAQDAAGSDRKKAALWEDARTGRCNFVIGSAQTAGTGVDVPDRLQVLDYMTLSWNPTQFEQWLGRIVRQGNQNPEVTANVWSTEGTIEVLRADKIAMKSAPFEALLDGNSETRRVNEETYDPLSAWAADMASRMSGNPLLNQQREAQLEVETAQGMQDEWQRENGVKARRVSTMNTEIRELEEENAAIGRALARAVDTQGDKFAAQVGTARYTARAEAGAALIAALAATAEGDVSALTGGNPQHLGELAGFPVTARYNRVKVKILVDADEGQDGEQVFKQTLRTFITLGLEGVPHGQVSVIAADELPDRNPSALITSLEDRIRRLPGTRDKNTAAIAENRDQIAQTKAELAKPSPYLQQLADARDALDRIETEIDAQLKSEPDAAVPADGEPAPASPGEPAADAGAERADGAAAPADGDIASLPPWTADSPYSAAIGAALQAALADSEVTQVARANDLSRFLEWLSHTDWISVYATAAIGDEAPPFALAVLDDPVLAADLTCTVGTTVHARCAGQALPPGSAALRPLPPMVEMSALRHWQEQDEAIGRAASTDTWYDLVDAARIDIWLSRAGLPREGRQVLIDSGAHAALELTAADGEQWRLTVPSAKDTRRAATARYKVTRSGRDGWESLLNGTPGSTTPEQAAALLIGSLTEQGALPPPPAAPAPGQAGVTPLPPVTPVPHSGPQPGTASAPTQPATSSPGDDSDARAPQPDSGPLRPAGDALPRPPGSGMTREELDFAYQHAYEFVLGAIRDPDQAQEERALDYAAWYMAEFGGAESLAGLPGHDHAWGWFIDRGYPARKPAAPAGGQRDGARPGTGATAVAAGPPGHADQQPSEVRRQHQGEARPDQAASPADLPAEQLDAMTEAALADRAIAGTARHGDAQNFEIAFTDWARHWLAATAVQAIDAARPGPAPPWAVALLDNEELIADMTTAAAGRVLRHAAADPRAGEEPGQPQGSRPPAPHQDRDDVAAATSQSGAPAPAVARDLIPPVTVLHGHVSEETAVEVPDYPYGSLRCTMRYWLETRQGHGVRMVHQTTNPKKPGQPRNRPHKDTYTSWAVLFRAANEHVEMHACEFWGPSPSADARIRLDGTYDQLDDAERSAYDKHVARSLNANTRGWEDWHAELASIRGHLAEHGTLPDPGQLARARGGLPWYEAEAIAAVAAVAAGLGGIHAAPPAVGQPGTSEPSPGPAGPPGHADPEPPADPWSAAGLRQLAEAYGLAAATDRSGGTLTVTVHDQGRTVLLHDDLNGTVAGGQRLNPAQVSAYVAAYADHPQLPPRCLLDLARHSPAEPTPLTLTAARETAARHGLEVRVRRSGGSSYINFCEPSAFHGFGGNKYTPVLSYPAGTDSAYHGPCAVPVAAIDSYLGAYRASVPTATFAGLEQLNCGYRATPLTPYLVDGSGLFITAVRDHWRAAVTAARDRNAAEVFRLLDEAEGLTPVSLTPEREAELTAAIRRHAARYRTAEDPAARLAAGELHNLEVTWREQGWVRDYIAAHPEVREHAEDEPSATLDSDREAAARLAAQAREALAGGEHERALALIDETELLRPDLASTAGYDRARDQVRTAMRQASPAPEQHAAATTAQGPADQATGAEEPGAAHSPGTRDANGVGTTTSARPVAAEVPPTAPVTGTGTEENAEAPAAAHPEPDTGDLNAEHRQPGSTAAHETASLAEGQEAPDASGTEAPATPAVAPGPARQEEHPPAAPAAGPGQPETAPVAGQAAADIPGAAAPAPAGPGQAPGPDEPAETGPYSGRVRIALESGRPVVSGTDFNDPPELREALRDNFTWDKKRKVWEYNAKKAVSPEEAAQAVRDVLARLNRESALAPAAKEFPPTPQQQAILDAFLAGLGIAVQALAGTGKTTTLVLLARALMERSPQARIVYTAFNASIVKDAKRGRFGRNVTASTMHSLARQALLQTGYAGKIEHADKGARWPEQWAEVLGIPEGTAADTRDGAAPADAAEVARLVIATVRKFRESADGEPSRQHLPYLAGPAGSPLSETVLSYARQAWADISDTGNAKALAAGRALRVEHDDYLKIWALSGPVINADAIFFDEAQDVNDVMRAVVLAQPAQTVVVGDSHQSIYGFRGAIDALKDWPADIVLPLTQSWRFGPAAAEFGNLFLRSLGSKLLLEGNPARATRLGSAPEPDAILCRTNATAVAEVFAGLESGKRTALAGGGDAIKEIAKAARDLQAGRGTKHPDLSRFADWGEVKDYARNDEDGKSLQVFVRLVDQHGPGGLIAMIDQLTPEGDASNPPQLTISTAHKAKGLEWDVVRVASDFRGPATDPETGEVTWPVPEERRLAYVAATRARKLLEPGSLTWIYDYPLPGNRSARGPASGQDHQAQVGTPGQPEHAGQEREPAPQAAPTTPEHSTADDAPAQQPAPAPATTQAPPSDTAASGQVPSDTGPDAGQQDPADGTDNAPTAPGQDSGGPEPGNAHPGVQPPAAESDPGEDRAASAAEPDGDRSPADGEPTGTRAPSTDDGAEPGEQPTAARSDPGTATAASPDVAGPPPEAGTAARLRALAEQHGMAVTTEQVSLTITVTTVTDGGRFVLQHDDFLGAAAEGTRIDLDEAEAYLGAWRAYPGLPALALLDWVRRGPDDPAQLSLSAARAAAIDCGLVAEPVRAAGQSFIVVRHPGLSGTVLACRPGDPAASTGPVTVPVPSVGTYLRLYQATVKPHWLTALGKRSEWASQLTAMVPYLINGTSLYSAEARRHVDAAALAAGTDDDRAVKDLLRRAWAAAGPFAPAPDREAVLLRVIGDVAPRFQEITGDGLRYAAETAHASDPEWAWIYQHVRDNPDILTAAKPTREALEQRDAGERAQAEAEGNALSAAAKDAFDAGDYPTALDLADQGETADPGRARRWEQIRGAIREKAAAAGHAPQTAIPERPTPAAPGADEPPQQQEAAATAEPAAAGTRASADAGPGARPGELSPLAVPAGRDEGVRFLQELAARYGLRVSHVTDTLKWWTVHLSALNGGAGVPVAEYEGHTGEWSGFGAGRLDPGEVAAYLAARGEGDLYDAPAGPTDPYTRIGQARYDYHKALLAYQALHETKAGRSLMETQDTEKPRPDAIALNAAYQAVSRGGWKKAFAGEAEEVTGRFAAWEHTARVMAGNLAATRHRAGIFRAALDAFTESAGHLASRTRATADDPGAWARVSDSLPRSTQAASPASGETMAPGDAPPAANPATAPSGSAPADEASPQPGRDEPARNSPAAAPARKASEPRSYRLIRQWPDGTVRESSTAFTSLRAAAQAVAYTLADNGSASRKDAAAFASRLQDAAPGTTMTHPSGYSFTIRLEAAVAPLRNMDLGAELDRMPGTMFARWLSTGATPPAAGDLEYQRPGAGSWATISEDGIEITVNEQDVTRHGLVTWPQAASWIDKGVTPARLGITVTATRLGAFVEQHRDQLAAAGTCDPGAVATELAQIRATAIVAIVEAARRSRGTAVPVPPALPGDPAWHTAVPVTRPGAGPGKAENKALERLLALRSLIRQPQPLTPQEVRDAIRREVSLADVARAMGDPATMRAWISDQARRTPSGSYDDSGRTWRGHGPDGLTADRHGDDRAPHVIAWDAILAWVAPGLAGGLREELLAADDAHSAFMRREIGAVINPGTVAESSAGEKDRVGRRLRAADTAAWAAIQAAPPPSPADFDRARYAARGNSPVQDSLFGLGDVPDSADAASAAPELPPAGQPGSPTPAPAEPGEPTPGTGAQAAAAQPEPAGRALPTSAADGITAPGMQAPGQRHPDDDAGRPGVNETPADHGREAPAQESEAEPPTEPVSNTDLVIAMRHVQGGFLRVLTEGKTPDGGGSHGWRKDDEPDARASQDIEYDPRGVEITLRGRGFRRHGRLSWAQIASWIDAGVTPTRLGIILTAGWLRSAGAARGGLVVSGTGDFEAVLAELDRIREDGVNAVIDAALQAHGAEAPVPPAKRGGPAFCTTAIATGPDEAASDAENAALDRLNQLRPLVYNPQPLTPQEVRTTIRRWIGDGLPAYAKALSDPAAMRAWVATQVRGPARRSAGMIYSTPARPGGRWYDGQPEGLRTATDVELRARMWTLIPWEEIPAWVQPGLTGSLHSRLLTAVPGKRNNEPDSLREALDAAWAAIEAAPPPSPAELDDARHVYDSARPAHPALFGDPPPDGTNTQRAAEPAQEQDMPAHPAATDNDRAMVTTAGPADDGGDADPAGNPAPGAGPSPDDSGSHPDTPPLSIPAPRPQAEPRQVELPGAARATTPTLPDGPFVPDGPVTGPKTAPAPAPAPRAGGPAPLTGDDIVLGVSRLPAFVLGELFHAADNGQPLGRAGYLLRSYSGERAVGEPDTGARETVTAVPTAPGGLHIEVAAPGGRRAGLVTWQQVDDLLRPVATPARRQIVTGACQAEISFTGADSSFRAVGEGRLAAAARDELTAIAVTVVGAILEAVHTADGTGFSQLPDEAAMTGRIAELTASLPAEPPRPRTPAAEVTLGDVIGHHSYRFHPFLVTEPPRQVGDVFEITGRLTEPEPGEPAGPFTLTVPPAGRQGAVVTVIPSPARSLRPLFPSHQITAGADQPALLPAPGSEENTEAPSVPAPAPAGEPQPPQPRNQEETMPPAPDSFERRLPVPPAQGEPIAAPSAPPTPAPPTRATGRIRYANPARSHDHTEAPGGGVDGASLTEELEHLLAALRERGGGTDGTDFSDIRATFAAVRNALSLPAASQETGPAQPAPAPSAFGLGPAAASQPRRREPGPAADGFSDIRETFADLRDILGLPASGRHARGDGPPDDADAAVARALDQAAAEAQACARWYRDTPEWQRTMTVGRAARDLVTAIRDAAGDYWAEIRQDIRVRGFARTLAARTALAVAGPAHLLGAGLERAGLQGSRPWRAAWGLHRAATTFANQVMRYDLPGSPDRMREARCIIAGLAQRQNSPAQPGPGRHAAPRDANSTRAPNAADLADASFPVTVSRNNARQSAAAPAARTTVPASRPHASRRQ